MKKIFLFILLAISSISFATNYTVATDGSGDFTTMDQVNAFTFSSGDSLLLKKGDVWSQMLYVDDSGVKIGAYGTGDNPLIYGRSTITGFTQLNDSTYYKIIDETDIKFVLFDGNIVRKGTYPEELDVNYSDATSTTITSDAFSTKQWDNAGDGTEIVVMNREWCISVNELISQSGSVVNVDPDLTNYPFEGYRQLPAMVQNHIGTFNENGDWAFRGDTLYVHSDDDISNHDVCISALDTGMIVIGDDISIENIDIQFIDEFAIIYIGDDISIDNVNIKYTSVGMYGGYLDPKSGLFITDCNISNCVSDAIIMKNDNDPIEDIFFIGNIIDSIGIWTGLQLSYYQDVNERYYPRFSGIFTECHDGSTFQNNTITNTGYIGIHYKPNNALIEYNYLAYTNKVLYDGGSIYTYTGGSALSPRASGIIRYNIGVGGGSRGLYLDENTKDQKAYGNSFINYDRAGFNLNDSHNDSVYQNTFYNCEYGAYRITNLGANPLLPDSIYFVDNIIYTQSGYDFAKYTVNSSSTPVDYPITSTEFDFGISDYNTFIFESEGEDIIEYEYYSNQNGWTNPDDFSTFAEHQAKGWDINSTSKEATPVIRYNATMIPVTAFADSSGTTVDGAFTDGITLAAFESVVAWDVEANPYVTPANAIIIIDGKPLLINGALVPINE